MGRSPLRTPSCRPSDRAPTLAGGLFCDMRREETGKSCNGLLYMSKRKGSDPYTYAYTCGGGQGFRHRRTTTTVVENRLGFISFFPMSTSNPRPSQTNQPTTHTHIHTRTHTAGHIWYFSSFHVCSSLYIQRLHGRHGVFIASGIWGVGGRQGGRAVRHGVGEWNSKLGGQKAQNGGGGDCLMTPDERRRKHKQC